MIASTAFDPMGDRYQFDFSLKKGWAQLDTTQDASYYGNWINPITLETLCFAEGDITRTKCETEAEFITHVHALVAWHKERDYFIGIDGPASSPRLKYSNLEEYLH